MDAIAASVLAKYDSDFIMTRQQIRLGQRVLPLRATVWDVRPRGRPAEGVDRDRIAASYENGVLEVRVPKPEKAKPRTIALSKTTESHVGGDTNGE
jgi:Hsp20/alpha crystallin family